MSEWWTYSLSDFLLFSPRTYYRLFELYNLAVWPWQIVAFALGIAVLALWLCGGSWRGRAIAAILAACWLWVAWAYLLVRYDPINWAARYFAIGFAIEAALLVWSGLIRDGLGLRRGRDAAAMTGLGMFGLALVAWPLIGWPFGRPMVQAEVFGVAPDPTVVATLGIILAAKRTHWELLVVPVLWCAISGATLWTMESPDAFILPAAALLAIAVTFRK
ncbi:MAG: DUF6064 family protein [Xanthobacteraceae bacterium]